MATEEATRHGSDRVEAIHMRLGPLSGVVKDALLFSYAAACEGTPLAGSRLIINDIPVTVDCPVCRTEREPASIQEFLCSVCGSPTPDVIHGRELEVIALELL